MGQFYDVLFALAFLSLSTVIILLSSRKSGIEFHRFEARSISETLEIEFSTSFEPNQIYTE